MRTKRPIEHIDPTRTDRWSRGGPDFQKSCNHQLARPRRGRTPSFVSRSMTTTPRRSPRSKASPSPSPSERRTSLGEANAGDGDGDRDRGRPTPIDDGDDVDGDGDARENVDPARAVPNARRVVDTGLMSPPPARARRDSGGVMEDLFSPPAARRASASGGGGERFGTPRFGTPRATPRSDLGLGGSARARRTMDGEDDDGFGGGTQMTQLTACLLYTSPSPRDQA